LGQPLNKKLIVTPEFDWGDDEWNIYIYINYMMNIILKYLKYLIKN
jgi:hypothetical protein